MVDAVQLLVMHATIRKMEQRTCNMVKCGHEITTPAYCERSNMTEDEQEVSDCCPQCEEDEDGYVPSSS